MNSMLKIEDISVFYGAIHAIKGVSLEVNQGEIVTLIGANGAGKSTILRTVSGLLKPKEGTISFEDSVISGMPAQGYFPGARGQTHFRRNDCYGES